MISDCLFLISIVAALDGGSERLLQTAISDEHAEAGFTEIRDSNHFFRTVQRPERVKRSHLLHLLVSNAMTKEREVTRPIVNDTLSEVSCCCNGEDHSTEQSLPVLGSYFVSAAVFFHRDEEGAHEFVQSHLQQQLEDIEDDISVTTRIYDTTRVSLGRQLIAARFAWTALGSLNSSQAEEFKNRLRKCHDDVPTGLLTSTSEKPEDRKLRRAHSDSLQNALADPQLQTLLQFSNECNIPISQMRGIAGLSDGYRPSAQRSRILPAGRITKDSYILLSAPDGDASESSVSKMPLLTLGTGYNDCYRGRDVIYTETGGSENATLGNNCSGLPEKGFYKKAVELGVRAIDTAYIYGTEDEIGNELGNDTGSYSQVFLSTKTVTPQFRNMIGNVKHGASLVESQLRSLRRSAVDVIYNHHDGLNDEEWVALDKLVDRGYTHMLGGCSVEEAIEQYARVKSGMCKHRVSLVQDDVSPCFTGNPGQKSVENRVRRLSEINATLVGISNLRSCKDEPIISGIAKRLGISVSQAALRWALEQGVPMLLQTSNLAHLKEDLATFDVELMANDTFLLSVARNYYGFDRIWNISDGIDEADEANDDGAHELFSKRLIRTAADRVIPNA